MLQRLEVEPRMKERLNKNEMRMLRWICRLTWKDRINNQ